MLIDTTYARRAPHSGTGVYLEQLCGALAELEGLEVIPACNLRRRPPAGGGLGSARNLLADERWIQLELPRRARAARADLIHHPLPALAHAARVPQVVTVHDLAFEVHPDRFDPAFRRVAHLTHRAAARHAGAVICVSEATAQEARQRWGIRPERIVVAPHGPGQALPAVAAEGAGALAEARPGAGSGAGLGAGSGPGPEPGYFLYVGDDEPRKNLPALVAAYARYRERAGADACELVLAGSVSAERVGAAGTVAAGTLPGVRLEPRPDAARLAELYAGATALVHAAVHEGFGMTLTEAMAAGVPVLAAPSPAALEVGGDALRYAHPSDAEGFAAAMLELAADTRARAMLVARGRERADAFSWSESARIHLAAYSLAVRMSAQPPRAPAFRRRADRPGATRP